MTFRALVFTLLSLACVSGCANWRHVPAPPVRNSVVLDQLVIHSETPLPEHHRLLQELVDQRSAIVTRLGLPVSGEPINIYLFPTADRFNEFMRKEYPGLPDRRAFFVETDTRLNVYAYWGDRVAEDLRHEVAHGYLHAVVGHIPLWLDEGLAEYFEVGRGRSGLNVAHVQELRDAVSRGWRPNLRRLEKLDDAGALTQLDYAEAWAWVHFLLETTSDRQAFLKNYLQLLLRNDSAEPMAHQLRRLHLDYERQLLDYVTYLGKSLQ